VRVGMEFRDRAADIFFRRIAKELKLGPVGMQDGAIGPYEMQCDAAILEEILIVDDGFRRGLHPRLNDCHRHRGLAASIDRFYLAHDILPRAPQTQGRCTTPRASLKSDAWSDPNLRAPNDIKRTNRRPVPTGMEGRARHER